MQNEFLPRKSSALITCCSGSGFRVQGSGFRVGFRVQGSGFRVWGSGFRVQGFGLIRIAQEQLRAYQLGLEFRVQGLVKKKG